MQPQPPPRLPPELVRVPPQGWWLRFAPPLEAEFREELEAGAAISRVLMCVLTVVMVGLAPVYDWLWLHPPATFVAPARMIQFGIEIPAALLCLYCTLTPAMRRYSAAATIATVHVVGGGLIAQRVIGMAQGFHVPHDFAAIAIVAALVMARLPIRVLVPGLLPLALVSTLTDLLVTRASAAAIYDHLSVWMLMGLAFSGTWLAERSERLSWQRGRLLEELAYRDSLTGLINRRSFDSQLERLVRQAARNSGHIAVLALDIDYFKRYNDHYGHPGGDEALRRLSSWMATSVRRPQDFCARIGGEEFAAVWFDADPLEAPQLAEKLRAGVEALGIPHAGRGAGFVVTSSGGFVQLSAPQPEENASAIARRLIAAADVALYEAKRQGRNRLVVGTMEASAPAQKFPA